MYKQNKTLSVERFELRFGDKVNTDSILKALKIDCQYAFDVINDNNLSSVARSLLLELLSQVYSESNFQFVKTKLNDKDVYLRSMAVETLIVYAMNGNVDHAIVEDVVYPFIKNETNEELKEHFGELYECLDQGDNNE